MTMLTALTIQNRDDIKVTSAGPGPNGKYAGWILLDVDRWRPLASTDYVYDSSTLAKEAMHKTIEEIRKMDLFAEAKKERELEAIKDAGSGI